MGNAEAKNAAHDLLTSFFERYSRRIQVCWDSPAVQRLNGILDAIPEFSGLNGVLDQVSVGTFERFQVPSLLEHFSAEKPHGFLLICVDHCPSEYCASVLWFRNGALIHADGMGLLGRAAVEECCRSAGGWYMYAGVPEPVNVPETLPGGRGITFLLLDILRRIDEERRGEDGAGTGDGQVEIDLPPISLDSHRFSEFLRLVEAVREGLLMQQRAELDAWYYRRGTEQTRRYGEIQRRALSRLYQWMAANGMMATVNRLQELPSARARCELLTELLDRLSRNIGSSDGEGRGSENGKGEIDWSILEEDGSAV